MIIFSATSTVIHVYGVNSAGQIIQRVLQSEMTLIDRFTNILKRNRGRQMVVVVYRGFGRQSVNPQSTD